MVELLNPLTAAWVRLPHATTTPEGSGLFTVKLLGMPWSTRLNSLDGHQVRIDGEESRQVVGVHLEKPLFGCGVLTLKVLV